LPYEKCYAVKLRGHRTGHLNFLRNLLKNYRAGFDRKAKNKGRIFACHLTQGIALVRLLLNGENVEYNISGME
jgi:hypothetical protein